MSKTWEEPELELWHRFSAPFASWECTIFYNFSGLWTKFEQKLRRTFSPCEQGLNTTLVELGHNLCSLTCLEFIGQKIRLTRKCTFLPQWSSTVDFFVARRYLGRKRLLTNRYLVPGYLGRIKLLTNRWQGLGNSEVPVKYEMVKMKTISIKTINANYRTQVRS